MPDQKASPNKRSARQAFEEPTEMASTPFIPMFENFRTELDEHHDRRERIVKSSRDITAASKKIIFALQRVKRLGQNLPDPVLKGCQQHYDAIEKNYKAVGSDLQDINAYRYSGTITHGNQEFMEAISFRYYLETQTLITHQEAQDKLKALCPSNAQVSLSTADYLLGIYDMTGELMKLAITMMTMGNQVPSRKGSSAEQDDRTRVLSDMRELRVQLESLSIPHSISLGRDVTKKMEVMRNSVAKVENAFYGLTVRGAERPSGWLPPEEVVYGTESA